MFGGSPAPLEGNDLGENDHQRTIKDGAQLHPVSLLAIVRGAPVGAVEKRKQGSRGAS